MSQKFQNTMKLVIPFTGHKEILSLHEKTLEITKDDSLTPQGDCIVGVNSNISCIDLPEKMKEKIQNPKSKITSVSLILCIENEVFHLPYIKNQICIPHSKHRK